MTGRGRSQPDAEREDAERDSAERYRDAIRAGDRRSIARAITLLESTRSDQSQLGRAILEALVPDTGGAIRVGITGSPGVAPLVKAATGEVVDAETLGGGSVHSRISGVTDHLADNDTHALAIAREIVANFNIDKQVGVKLREPVEPVYPAEDIYGIVSREYRFPYDVREVIARIVDGSEFQEFKKLYGSTLVCGYAHVNGCPVG